MSKYYGERKANELAEVKRMAYIFPVNLAFIGCAIMYFGRWHVGTLFRSSDTVNSEIAKIISIFLVSVSFFSNFKNFYCWILCNRKSSIVLCFDIYWTCPHAWLMLILPPLFGGQITIWWSTVFARIISAMFALLLTALNKGSSNL